MRRSLQYDEAIGGTAPRPNGGTGPAPAAGAHATARRAAAVQPTGREPILEVANVTHRYGDTVALDGVSVAARQGEFLTILGESGSGKTTLLRIISGLERPTRIDRLAIAGQDVRAVPASDRNCTTVFQHYALFPHMSVGENVEYGLRVRGVPQDERRRQAREALELVRLADKYDRRVHQLSGGERQRVALARALVTRPAILLLDEPLGALDEKLRLDMQVELRDLHAKLGMTFVYITHSQEEALTMSDRVIIMRRGRIEQEGGPRDLFDRPASRFVASFMGVENLLDGAVAAVDGRRVTLRAGTHALTGIWCGKAAPVPGAPACAGVRAERVRIAAADAAGAGAAGVPNRIGCRLGGTVYKGKYFDQTAETDIGPIHARIWEHDADLPQPACLWWREEDCVVMPSC